MTILSKFAVFLPRTNEPTNTLAKLDTPLVANAYNVLPWAKDATCVDYKDSYFNNGVWTPPAGLLEFGIQIRIVNGLEQNQVITAKLRTGNGDSPPITRALVGKKGNYEGSALRDTVYVCDGAPQCVTDGTISYSLDLYTSDALFAIDAHQSHTWWTGMCYAL
jgi:hypothetical protein